MRKVNNQDPGEAIAAAMAIVAVVAELAVKGMGKMFKALQDRQGGQNVAPPPPPPPPPQV